VDQRTPNIKEKSDMIVNQLTKDSQLQHFRLPSPKIFQKTLIEIIK
jgi:hypothetical protein